MNLKFDFASLKPKRKRSSFSVGLLTLVICLGAQMAMANPETNLTKVKINNTVQSTITGIVTDDTGAPLPGANVLVKGTTTGTQTDFDGNFTIEADSDATLIFSYIGFKAQEIAVNGNSTVNASLIEDAAALEEVIVTGYSTESKRETTAAVSIVKAEELAAIPSGNVEQQLQGRVAGVTVISNGQPGTTSQIRVRGFNSFGNNSPLYVVDGVPTTNIDFLSPDDILNTSVLKDAAAASIYGARAANGVIVYTTKQGRKGDTKSELNISLISGVTDPNVAGAPQMLNPQEMAEWTHQSYRNNAIAEGTAPGTLPNYDHPQYGTNATPTFPDYLHANGDNGVYGSVDMAAIQAAYAANPDETFLIKPNLEGTNWYKEITRIAPQTRFSMGFKGGSENSRYYLGLSSQQQSGIVLEQEFKRYTARFNSEWDVTPWLSIGENFQTTYRSAVGIFGGSGGVDVADDESEVLSAYRMPTIIPVYDEFGSYASTKAAGFNNPRNPVRRLERNAGDDKSYSIGGFGNLYANFNIMEGLTVRTSIGGTYNNYHYVDYNYKYLGDSETEANNSFGEGGGYGFNWTFTNTATYEKTFGKHGIKILAGIESLNTGSGRNISGSGQNPFSTDLDYQDLSAVQNPVVQSNWYKGANYSSVFGELKYNFNEKYYVAGVVRRDGSSRFGSENRYGVFPAFSAAWRVIDEPFLQDQDVLSDLKFRGGWGKMGNDTNVDPNNQYSLYGSDRARTFYPIAGTNDGASEGFARSRIGNSAAKWETSTTLNIGFDASFFNNKLDIVLDWWSKETEDLLYEVPLPAVVGSWASAPAVNIASMENKGVDLQIIGRGNFTEDLSFEITTNYSFLNNEITSLAPNIDYFDGPSIRGNTMVRNQIGLPMSSFFGYKMIGYFNSQADVDAENNAREAAGLNREASLGRFKYEDIDGDGLITADDRTFIGSAVPDFTGGAILNLKYKNIEFETYWYASLGNEIYNQSKWYTDFQGTFEGSAKGERVLNSWTPELGDNAEAPIFERATNLYTSGAANSWYVEDGSYLRLQRLSLSYAFDQNLLDKIGINKMKLGFAANNIWTITKYTGLDPMVAGPDTNFGVDTGNFPVTPSYVFSLELGL
ncbi:TonB-dependent receptor [Aurantibacter sp.]|uniref:SusC/RagA family TonB-linked outer membrane protein n=1 Tax=Aurantibacter sp. TaxID=2807103 RepID=UPI0032669599